MMGKLFPSKGHSWINSNRMFSSLTELPKDWLSALDDYEQKVFLSEKALK